MSRFASTLMLLTLCGACFAYGMLAGHYKWFPHAHFATVRHAVQSLFSVASFDDKGRLVEYVGKQAVPCPPQTSKTGVLVAFGQSNAANHAEYRFRAAELDGVINFFEGTCFAAASPLLGATGKSGEWLSKTARHLIEMKIYNKVIIASAAVGASRITRWARDNDLNNVLVETLRDIKKFYDVTEIVWHQGESDARFTLKESYKLLLDRCAKL